MDFICLSPFCMDTLHRVNEVDCNYENIISFLGIQTERRSIETK